MSWDPIEVWTPGEIDAYIASVSDGFDSLQRDMQAAGSAYPLAKFKAFALALASFRKWRDNVSYLSRLTLSPLRIAEQYAAQLQYWREDLKAETGIVASGALVPMPGGSDGAAAMVQQGMKLAGLGIAAYVGVQLLKLKR